MPTSRIAAGQTRKSTEFEDFADTVVHADVRIAAGRSRSLLVFRQRDSGIWYALCGSRRPQLVRVAMRGLVDRDRSLAGLGEMPHGKGVRRDRPETPWSTCASPPSADQEALPYLLDVVNRRIARWADRCAALLIFPGLACGLAAGYLQMMGPAATSGVATTWTIPLAVASIWLFVTGVIASASKHALWALLGAFGMALCAMGPLLIPTYDPGRWRAGLLLPAVLALLIAWPAVRMAWAKRSERRWRAREPGRTTADAVAADRSEPAAAAVAR